MRHTDHDFDTLPEIRDVETLFAIAVAMEAEAAERYARSARRMDEAGQPELAALFRELEAEEREHETGVEGWAGRQGIDANRGTVFRWQSPESLTEAQFAEAGGEALMTPESALNLAIHNEQRAFSFYVRIGTQAEDAQLRRYAERMASEEINHVARLRLARRRAYRERRDARTRAPIFEDVARLAEYVDAQRAEARDALSHAAAGCRAAGHRRIARALEALSAPCITQRAAAVDDAGALAIIDAQLRRAEAVYDRLIRTAEQTSDETLLLTAQTHAATTLEHLAKLNDLRAGLRNGIDPSAAEA
ncbi:Rubrerythrin protein [Salinisphaera shabanensis E1L3A]|uniref:Rubrerythrin protein n=1 Tax=Salinisphaera shabanensis E1L3A TaxID=1033802 RepID=U2FMP0_9GAMM|nr:ferritin family protein [Salinisphaera shabanensis]ERJ17489.1 Rubrerythrin protein [Salinisphaera shabanensis E1L3A]